MTATWAITSPAIIIGIDPGTNTGFARYDRMAKRLVQVDTLPIHKAMQQVQAAHVAGYVHMVVFEDARLRKWFGHSDLRMARSGAGIREGVGSVKRDCSIWADFLGDLGVPYKALKPSAGMTKLDAEPFAKLTGWTARTSNHARDAAMLCWGM